MIHFRSDIQMIFQDPYSSLNPRMIVKDIIQEPMNIQRILSNKEKELLTESTKQPTKLTLKMDEFQKLYSEDGLNHAIRDVPSWLRETFKVLNSF